MAIKSKSRSIIVLPLVVIVAYSLWFSFFYNYLVRQQEFTFDKKFKNISGQLIVHLPNRDTYFIKVWGISFPERVYFNNQELLPFKIRKRGTLKELYVKVKQDLVNKDKNILTILSEGSYSVKVRNFYGITNSKDVVILFKNSQVQRLTTFDFFQVFLLTGTILFFVCLIFYSLIKIIFLNFKFKRLLKVFCLYNLGLFLLVSIFLFVIYSISYRVILSSSTFLGWSLFYIFLINPMVILHYFLRYSKGLLFNPRFIGNISSLQIELTKKFYEIGFYGKKITSHFLDSIDEKCGKSRREQYEFESYTKKLIANFIKLPGIYLVGIFILLLVGCMLLLTFKLYTLANWVSYLAYFCLATGLIIEFVKLVKKEE